MSPLRGIDTWITREPREGEPGYDGPDEQRDDEDPLPPDVPDWWDKATADADEQIDRERDERDVPA